MQITFGNNPISASDARKKQAQPGPVFAANSGKAKDVFSKSTVKFGNEEFMDPDLDDFLDLVDRENPPDHLLDQIVRGRQKVNSDGSISFPVNRIDKPSFNHGPNPPYEAGNEGEDGDDGDGQSGPGKPGNKPGKGQPGPGDPDTGVGPGDVGDEVGNPEGEGEGEGNEAGEGEGDYGREMWSAPYSPSDIAKLMGKMFGLPNLEDRGRGKIKETFETFNSKRRTPPGKILLRPTMKRAAGREIALVEFDNENLEKALKVFRPALEKFATQLAAAQQGATPVTETVGEFKTALAQFERTGFPIIAGTRDTVFDAKLAEFKKALPQANQPAFLQTTLPAFRTAVDNIKRRTFGDGEHIFVNETSDIERIATRVNTRPHTQAIIFYVMDVSGSISNDMKQMARTNNFLLSTWLKYQYGLLSAKSQGKKYNDKDFFGKGVQERFIVHTDGAKEVSGEEFYTTRQSGGTTISSAYKKILDILEEEKINPKDWNIYIFQYSDGDSWGDNDQSGKYIDTLIGDYKANRIGYCNLRDPRWGWFGGNNFDSFLKQRYGDDHAIVRRASLSQNSMDIYRTAIQKMLEEKKEGGK